MSSRTPGRRRPRRPLPDVCLLAVLALAAVPLAACGKKGDPAPPLRHVPATTEGLTVSQRGSELLLEMPYPTTTTAGQALSGLERVEVYRLLRPVPAADLDLLEAEPGDEAPAAPEVAPEAAPDAVDTDEQVDEDEPPEPDDDDSQMAAELGIVAADEADQVQAQLEVAEEFAEASEEARAAAQAETEAAAVPGTDRASRRRQLLAAADPRELRGAELVLAFAGDDLASAVVGGELVLRLPLPQPLPEAPEVHRYAVRTVAGVEVSAFSNQAAIVPRTPPPPPRELDAEARADGVQLTWEPQDDGIVGYNVYRRLVTARWFEVPVAVPSPDRSTYLDRGAAIGGSYIYAVTAVAQRQPLIESAVAEVQEVDYRDRFAPPTPASLVALAEEGRVRLVWEGSEADDLAGYRVLRRRGAEGDFAPLTAEPQTNTEYVDTAPEAGVTYTYRVVAVDRIGNESEPAEAATEAR
jgi:hypothetical protein